LSNNVTASILCKNLLGQVLALVIALLHNRSLSDLQSLYIEVQKAAVKKSKEKSWEEFSSQLDSSKQSIWANDPSVTWKKIKLLFRH